MNVLVIDRVDGRVRGLVVLPDGTLEVEDADLTFDGQIEEDCQRPPEDDDDDD